MKLTICFPIATIGFFSEGMNFQCCIGNSDRYVLWPKLAHVKLVQSWRRCLLHLCLLLLQLLSLLMLLLLMLLLLQLLLLLLMLRTMRSIRHHLWRWLAKVDISEEGRVEAAHHVLATLAEIVREAGIGEQRGVAQSRRTATVPEWTIPHCRRGRGGRLRRIGDGIIICQTESIQQHGTLQGEHTIAQKRGDRGGLHKIRQCDLTIKLLGLGGRACHKFSISFYRKQTTLSFDLNLRGFEVANVKHHFVFFVSIVVLLNEALVRRLTHGKCWRAEQTRTVGAHAVQRAETRTQLGKLGKVDQHARSVIEQRRLGVKCRAR